MTDMEPSRFQRLHALFEAAFSLPPERWRSFLAAQTNDDPSLIDEAIDTLRRHADGDVEFMARVNAATAEAAAQISTKHPRQIGPFRILRVLGQGGMGTVYEAEQTGTVRRRVALKVIKGLGDQETVLRFERERRELAKMQHDGIAKVYEGGTTEQGDPYFAMELVSGKPFADYCDDHRLSLEKRIRLLRRLCAAIQHAHQKGVVHRDLKPGNVLVSDADGKLQIKVIDFGLAKSIREEPDIGEFRTLSPMVMGTPVYMAPEQANFDGPDDDVDTRADIYSLGVIAYEVLVGSLPLTQEILLRDGWAGLPRVLNDQEPERPSERLSRDPASPTIAAARKVTVQALHKALKKDLDWVVLKALEKDRDRRYATASELAADLQRFLDDEPVQAGPPSAAYRITKFVRRNRARVLMASVLLLISVVSGSLITVNVMARHHSNKEKEQVMGLLKRARLRENLASPNMRELPANVAHIDRWLEEARTLLARRSDFEHDLRDLRHQFSTFDAGTKTWSYADPDQAELQEDLVALLKDFESLQKEHIPEVERRHLWASWLPDIAKHPSWDVARAAIREDKQYGPDVANLLGDNQGKTIGLLPIGKNSQSGLWEFYHLRSAWNGVDKWDAMHVPTLDGVGKPTPFSERTGIVLVLLPGGRVQTGVVPEASDGGPDNWDPSAVLPEEKMHCVQLDPFLVARHEMTRSQWARLGGECRFLAWGSRCGRSDEPRQTPSREHRLAHCLQDVVASWHEPPNRGPVGVRMPSQHHDSVVLGPQHRRSTTPCLQEQVGMPRSRRWQATESVRSA